MYTYSYENDSNNKFRCIKYGKDAAKHELIHGQWFFTGGKHHYSMALNSEIIQTHYSAERRVTAKVRRINIVLHMFAG